MSLGEGDREIEMPTNRLTKLAPSPTPEPRTPTARIRPEVGQPNSAVLADIQSLTIVTEDDYHDADLLLVRIRQARKLVKSKTADMFTAAKTAYQTVKDFIDELDDPLEEGEKAVKGKMAEWQRKDR